MARTRFVGDSGLTVRMTSVMFLLGAVFVGLVVTLLFVMPPAWAPIIGIIGIGIAWGQWYFSDTVAMKAMRAREVTPQEAPELHQMIDRLCALADMPKPRVAIAYTDMPNAFATGRSPKHAVVAVTQGLVDRLEPHELEGVIAHELSHVAHRDVAVMTIASFFAMVAGFITRWGFYFGGMFGGGFGGGRDDRNNSGASFMVILLVSVVVYAISFFLIRALSRYREFAADRGAAILTKSPSSLASALVKITGAMGRIPQRDMRMAEGLNQFFIIPAGLKSGLSTLVSDHPPLEARLEQLRRLERQLETL
jgi:heat shock protein HtpX